MWRKKPDGTLQDVLWNNSGFTFIHQHASSHRSSQLPVARSTFYSSETKLGVLVVLD